MSCYLGICGGLTERLAELSPITTSSFVQPVIQRDVLPRAQLHFAAIVLALYGGWQCGNANIAWLLGAERTKHDEGSNVNVYRLVFDLTHTMDDEMGHLFRASCCKGRRPS